MARLGQYRHRLHRRSARQPFLTWQRADEDNLGTLLLQQVSVGFSRGLWSREAARTAVSA
jgi:hypothetical protein